MDDFEQRIEKLYIKHYDWLFRAAINLTKDVEDSEDLVQSLFVYLLEKRNVKIFYKDTFNLLYCHRFIKSRFLNKKKRDSKMYNTDWFSEGIEDEEYDTEMDNDIMLQYSLVQLELDKLKNTKLWSDALIFKEYVESDSSLNDLANKYKISKSTVFLSCKKIKSYLKTIIHNPLVN
jgi:hypothetical protein